MSNPMEPHSERRPVAYLNDKFLNSPDARALRILSEFLEPLAHFRREKVRDTVVFFGSARIREGDGELARYYDEARALARMLPAWSPQFTNNTYRFVVCSGGGPGILAAAHRGAGEAEVNTGGRKSGRPGEQGPNPDITPERSGEVHDVGRRKGGGAD